MYKVSQEKRNGLNLCQIKDVNTGEYICILPDVGCALNNYVIMHNGKASELVDGYINVKDLQDNLGTVFKGHFLFPFPNRIIGGTYEFHGEDYFLRKNFLHENNAIHGLLYDKVFSLESQSESEHEANVTFVNEMTGNYEGYPFNCQVKLHFTYSHRSLSVVTEVVNKDNKEIPVCIGWHPYFKVGERIDDLHLHLPDCEQWDSNKNEFSDVHNSGSAELNDKFLDTCFRKVNSGSIVIEDKNAGITVVVESGNHLPYFQLYTPPHRRSIAIEPMSCVPNSFNNKIGLKVLKKEECWVTKWTVNVINA